MSIDDKLKEIYIKKYPINHVAKYGNMIKDPLNYIVNYEKEVIEEIIGRAPYGVEFRITSYGLRDHKYDNTDVRLDKSTFDTCYINYYLKDSKGESENVTKEFYLHQIGDRSDYWVRGIHLYIAPIVSGGIMTKSSRPGGDGILTRFRREKQVLSPYYCNMVVNGVRKSIRISYNEKPFKLITLEEKPGYNNKVKSPTILMTIYNKGLEHVLNKYYNSSIKDFDIFPSDEGLEVKADDKYCLVKGLKGTATIRCINDHKIVQLATAILHVIDVYKDVEDMIQSGDVSWEAKSHFLVMLVGKSMFHDTCPSNNLLSMLNKQEEFISAYMVTTIKNEFLRMGYDFEDIYDYYATCFHDFDKILFNEVEKSKRIESLYYLYSNIINKVNKEYEHALKDLEDGKLKSAVKRVKSTIFKNSNTTIKSSNSLAIYPYTAIGDAFPITVASITSLQELGHGNDKATGSLDVKKGSISDIEPNHLLFGNSYYITNSNTNSILSHNIHCQFTEDGSPIFDREFSDKLGDSLGKLEA